MSQQAKEIIEYIVNVVLRSPDTAIDEDTPLVSSGLIDSFALVEILLKLEDVTRMRIPAGKVGPKDMNSVRLMFETAQRVGKPRK
jgi:acyl carrier protein